jgi:ATP-dependent protease ClpP protease subunit
MDTLSRPAAPADLARPQIRLHGEVDDAMLAAFLEAVAGAPDDGSPLVVELTTVGGDAEVGRRIASDVRQLREQGGRRVLFLGKAAVYSAGVTIMSAFPRADRWLARGTMLLIHCRKLDKTVTFQGSLQAERLKAEALMAEIDAGLRLQESDFQALIQGSSITLPELLERAEHNWYLDADEAVRRRLIAGTC